MSQLARRRRAAMTRLLEHPSHSDNAIAHDCEVSPQSVLNWRHDFEAIGLLRPRVTGKVKPMGNQYTKRANTDPVAVRKRL